jgi:hypothetical protein
MGEKRARFFQVREDTGWVTPTRKHKMACCDCGLVHNFQFRIVRIERLNGRKFDKLAVQFKANRNTRSTAGRRRGAKVKASLRAMAGA